MTTLHCPECGYPVGHGSDCSNNLQRQEQQGGVGAYARPTTRSGCSGCGIAVVVALGVVVLIGGAIAVFLGIIAPNRGLDPAQVAAIEDLVDRPWEGQVRCGDDLRGISVDFERQARAQDHVTGRVSWHDGDSADAQVLGGYDVRGTFNGTRLRVEPDGGTGGARVYPSLAFVGDVAQSDTDTAELTLINGAAFGDDACQEFWLGR